MKITVVDPDGNPVKDALVVPTSMTLKENPTANMSWVDREPEKVANLYTDEKGELILTYPDPAFGSAEVSRIGMEVSHSSFVKAYKIHQCDR